MSSCHFGVDLLVMLETGKFIAGFEPGGATGVHDTDLLHDSQQIPL